MSPTESVRRIVRFGFQNYFRSGWLSLAATLVMAMTLFTVSVFVLQAYVNKVTTKSLLDKLDMAVYINDNPKEEDVTAFVAKVKSYPEVKQVIYLNKDQVIVEWNKLPVTQKIKGQVTAENNPLPRTLRIQTYDVKDLDTTYNRINQDSFASNIHSISYGDNRPVIKPLDALAKNRVRDGLILSTIFITIAIVFIFNTIRIIIRFRQDEIGIMKLVGATDWFVRGPFIVEGALYGIIATFVTLAALYFYLQSGLTDSTVGITSPDSLVAGAMFTYYKGHLFEIGLVLMAGAVAIAAVFSSISVHYHLKR